jgi:membrane-associated phospholipid phosphatase
VRCASVFRRSAAAPIAAAYATLAVLVAAGALTGLDQWAVDHLMPGRPGTGPPPSLLEAAVPLLHAAWNRPLALVANVVTLPAQALVASALVAVCCLVLRRRGRRGAALAWAIAWVAGNAVEVLCKSVLARPHLYRHGLPIPAFESSFPSGHTLRAVLLAAAAALWPQARWWLAAWVTAAIVLLEADGMHTPSDIAGGLLLAGLLIAIVRRLPERR